MEPNEISFERPYIAHNIQLTRHGFGLDRVEEREFAAGEELTPETVEANQNVFSNIRLWDWRALDSVYEQFQEIRLYYEFLDVDIDRYRIDDSYRQVMVSARELNLENLPPKSRTFVNQRFKYTHGYGITLTRVNEFTEDGLPNLLIKDIPPRTETPGLEIDEPRIYYGEQTADYVVVNTEEKEFDFPRGEENDYGRFLAYKFPKEKRVLGPQQVETKIDQDSYLSGQLTLWDQRGSTVIRGNVLAIPVDDTLFYVEPIYLKARTAAYPELRLVAVMHGDDLSYAESFGDALRGLFDDGPTPEEASPTGEGNMETLVKEANEAFESHLRHQGNGAFAKAADALERLRRALDRLAALTGSGGEE